MHTDYYPMELPLHLVGVILAIAATVWAIYLVPLTGKSKAWLLLSAAFILLAIERLLELCVHAGIMFTEEAGGITSDVLHVVIMSCLLGGIFYTRAIFLERQAAQRKLEKQLDELQRFHKVAMARELRMKELYEENQALRARLGETGSETGE